MSHFILKISAVKSETTCDDNSSIFASKNHGFADKQDTTFQGCV